MIEPCPPLAEVPQDLQQQSAIARRWHRWKASAAIRSCVPLHRLLPPPQAAAPGILMYHRVVPVHDYVPETLTAPTWNVTPDAFCRQLSGLLQRGYVAWSLTRLLETMHNAAPVPPGVFVVTFDDGYANNLIHAVPILQRLQIPATVFLATHFVDSPQAFPFDDWAGKGSAHVHPDTWRPLTRRECEACLNSGVVEFGSHTHTHEDFRGRPHEFAASLQESRDQLATEFGVGYPPLSLPYGIVRQGFAGPAYFDAARQAGMSCCLTTEEELILPGDSPFGWGRFIAEQHDTVNTLGVKLDGWRDHVRNAWRKVRRGQPPRR